MPKAQAAPLGGAHFAQYPPIQCAQFARIESGLDIVGDANAWWRLASGRYPQSNFPSVGAVIAIRVWDDGTRGHVAVVRQIVSDRVILVDHANWHGRGEVALNVPVRDVSAANDWSEVNVWNLDVNSWGVRKYHVDGFIHPR